jgi:hypothetical protein
VRITIENMKKLFLVLIILASNIVTAQSLFSGKVETEEGLSIANVLVINLKTNEKVNTDENGKFIISAKLQDEIRFVKKGYDRVSYIVKSADFQEEKYFRLQKSTVTIEEVIISRLKLTGNLVKDSKSLDKEDVNAKIQKSLGTETIEKQVRSISGSAGISFNMASLLAGKKKKEQKQRLEKYEQFQNNATWISERVDSEYFVSKGIPEVKVAEFIQFSLTQKPEVAGYIKTNNFPKIMTALDQLIPVYLKKIEKKTT